MEGERRTWTVTLLLLVPPLVYTVAGFSTTGFGQPFMLSYLYGPDSSHTTIGLLILLFAKAVCPVAAAVLGIALAKGGSRVGGVVIIVVAVGLLMLNLATRQPYSTMSDSWWPYDQTEGSMPVIMAKAEGG